MSARAKPRQPFRTESIDLGRLLISGIDNVGEALEPAEIDALKQR